MPVLPGEYHLLQTFHIRSAHARSICGKAQKSAATLNAQSGKQEKSSIKMATPCKKRGKK